MSSEVKTIARKGLILLALFAALLAIPYVPGSVKVEACETCHEEANHAYAYCSQNPDGIYSGCYVYQDCSDFNPQYTTATVIQRENCCDVDPWAQFYVCGE